MNNGIKGIITTPMNHYPTIPSVVYELSIYLSEVSLMEEEEDISYISSMYDISDS